MIDQREDVAEIVDALAAPDRYYLVTVTETTVRQFLVDEYDAEQIVQGKRTRCWDGDWLYDLARAAASEPVVDGDVSVDFALGSCADEELGPHEACPECGGQSHYIGRPDLAYHESSCRFVMHSPSLDYGQDDAGQRTVRGTCRCPWRGPEHHHGVAHTGDEGQTAAIADVVAHCRDLPHTRHVPWGLPGTPYPSWRPLPAIPTWAGGQ